MVTFSSEVQRTRLGAAERRWTAAHGRHDVLSVWLVVVAYAMAYSALSVGAVLAAVTLAAALSGPLGVAVFYTVGLGLVAAAPVVTRVLFARVLEAREARRRGAASPDELSGALER